MKINWKMLRNDSELGDIKLQSEIKPQVIFKHSTRCSVSSMVKNRLEKSVPAKEVDFYFLDLIAYRSLSNKVATEFLVEHQSPQILIIKNGACVYDESHHGITMSEITERIKPS
jgi:bacillithiol system protein YtxJ